MADEETPKRGYFIGRTYYSSNLPKNAENPVEIKWSVEDSQLFNRMYQEGATTDDTYNAQVRLHQLGYLEKHLIDGKRGLITDGAIYRWKHNAEDGSNRWWNSIKDVDIMKEGAEPEVDE